MIKIFSPDNEIELALLRGLLDGSQIPYFVHNDHFGTMRTGPRIKLLNQKTIMVPPAFEQPARQVLADFLENMKAAEEPEKQTYSWADKVRMVFETLLFGWYVPGNRWTEKRRARKQS